MTDQLGPLEQLQTRSKLRAWGTRASSIVDLVQRPLRRGSRTVVWAPQQGLGFGNFLYLWLYAHTRRAQGIDCVVLTPKAMDPWLSALPALHQLSIHTRDVRLTDRRVWSWNSRFGDDFQKPGLRAFISDCIIGPHLVPGPKMQAGEVTVNIRRGNYYSEPHFRGTYGFDIPTYLGVAIERFSDSQMINALRVVSDDPEWCRLKLHGLLLSHASDISYAPPQSPQTQFRHISTSTTLIGTNSSFSYWGGYVSNLLYGSQSHVVILRFHGRFTSGFDAYQLDPEWDIIESIPGGWDV